MNLAKRPSKHCEISALATKKFNTVRFCLPLNCCFFSAWPILYSRVSCTLGFENAETKSFGPGKLVSIGNYGGILKRFSLSKNKRLATNKQFEAVLARNLRVSNGLLTLFMAENDCGYPRLGVSVAKSCGNAVVRNRLKRLLREAFRQSQGQIPAGFDCVLMISPQWSKKLDKSASSKETIRQLTFRQVKASLLALVTKAVGKIE